MKPIKDITDPKTVKALAHPMRIRILATLDERTASPSELASELGAPIGNVSYHVRILDTLGLIRLVRTTPKRGAIEHHYEAVARPIITDETWATVPDSVKHAIIGATLDNAGRIVADAATSGGFRHPEARLSRTPLRLDAEGWRMVASELMAFMEHAVQIGRDAEARLKDRGGDADVATLVLMLFDEVEAAVNAKAPAPSKRRKRRSKARTSKATSSS